LFKAFLTNHPTSELAPRAQWWVASYYFDLGDYVNADLNYQWVFQPKWAGNDLFYEAQMMAGRAVVASKGLGFPKDALDYFARLFNNPSCPMDLKLQAAFASADVLFSVSEPDEKKRRADMDEAIDWLKSIPRLSPTNAIVPAAWARLGDCYKTLGDIPNAIDAYQRVTNGGSSICAQAKIGLGLVDELRAAATNGTEQAALRTQALIHYLDAYGELRSGDKPDLNWSSKAGLEAARLAETMEKYEQAVTIYEQIRDFLPSMRSRMDKRIAKARELAQGKK
jgi:tetratricopeptide (TPR) repeat protein